MENITINTSQNVFIRHNIATLGERILAALLDGFFVFVYISLVSLGTGVVSNASRDMANIILIVFLLPVLFYHLIFEVFFQGQSLGKKVMKIKVAKIDGTQPSLGSFFIRWVFRLIEISATMGSVALVSLFINGKGQRLGDLVAKTTVISLKERADVKKTIYIEVPESYNVKYPEVNILDESDISTIFDVLRFYQENAGSYQANEMIRQTASAIEKKIGITPNEPPIQFLRSVVYDFNSIYRVKK